MNDDIKGFFNEGRELFAVLQNTGEEGYIVVEYLIPRHDTVVMMTNHRAADHSVVEFILPRTWSVV